jgi:zinc/manganese transport system substrate-binding protein
MTKHFFYILIALLFSLHSTTAQAAIHIFACEPEWKALAETIGGEDVEVYSATTAMEDPHTLSIQPSLVTKMQQADMVLCTGAGLEITWLPFLIQKAGKNTTQPDAIGHLMASDYVKLLEKPKDGHPEHNAHSSGNPHIHLNPKNLVPVSRQITVRLGQLDKKNANKYIQRQKAFEAMWKTRLHRWKSLTKGLNGMPIITSHKHWDYLADWLNLSIVGTIEIAPGVPPSAKHLVSLVKGNSKLQPKAILVSPSDPAKPAEWLSEKTGVKVLYLPYTIGGSPQATSLEKLFDETVTKLIEAAK